MKTLSGTHGSPIFPSVGRAARARSRGAARGLLLAAAFLLAGPVPARAVEPGLAELQARITRAAKDDPKPFQAVAALKRGVPSFDQKRRGPVAVIAPLLKAQKAPVVWALASEALGGMSSPEWLPAARTAWAVGVLEALGSFGEPLTKPAALQALRTETDPEVVRAAAAALGQVDREAADVLLPIATHAGPRQVPVISGLAECRTGKAARGLAELLARKDVDPAVARAAAKSLGSLGSSWVWQMPAYAARPEKEEVRSTAARALLDGWLRSGGETRSLAERALLVVDWDGTSGLIEKARGEHPEQRGELERLARKIAENPVRR